MTDDDIPKPVPIRVYILLDEGEIRFARGTEGPVCGDSFVGLVRNHGLVEKHERVELVLLEVRGKLP